MGFGCQGMAALFKRARDMEATARDKYLEMAEKETNPAAARSWRFSLLHLSNEPVNHFHTFSRRALPGVFFFGFKIDFSLYLRRKWAVHKR